MNILKMPADLPEAILNPNAEVVLQKRYLKKGLDGKPIERAVPSGRAKPAAPGASPAPVRRSRAPGESRTRGTCMRTGSRPARGTATTRSRTPGADRKSATTHNAAPVSTL